METRTGTGSTIAPSMPCKLWPPELT
jgi:hypothetical protein